MSAVGFVVEKSETTLSIDTGQKTWKQIVSDKVSKRDLVINFRKPKPNDLNASISIKYHEPFDTLNEKSGLNLDNLPEAAMANVKEDYQVCTRALARKTKE
jgi:hypothetical protein